MIVVTGATGSVGRPLVEALAPAGAEVTAVSRHGTGELPAGVAHRRGDLADVDGLEGLFEGAEAVYLLVAGLGDDLRPRGFVSNAFLWADRVRSARTVAAPFADVDLLVVDPADIAEVAAAALRGPAHAGRTYVLTVPVAVTPREQPRALAKAVGAPVGFTALGADETRERLVRFLPEEAVDGMLPVMGDPGEEERRVSPDVERVLGRVPRPFSAWAERHAGAFA
ncbi:NAD-dependent epimerase/dehydratase family protein [Streptomyces sp. NPDC012825]|uniref:NAD-dependent epimerase/dehydratase family protein n=1 Tax=Streptomyces sp. NPDC012825 TaxID=3364851 RepID=UPI0036C44DEC